MNQQEDRSQGASDVLSNNNSVVGSDSVKAPGTMDSSLPTPRSVVQAPPSDLKFQSTAKIIKEKSAPGASIYATIPQRYFAMVVDGFVVTLFSILLNMPYYSKLFQSLTSSYGATLDTLQSLLNLMLEQQQQQTEPVYTVLSYLAYAIYFLYPIVFIGTSGATPGKALFKIKVVDKETEEAPGFLKAFMREFIGKLISTIILGIGYAMAINDKDKQALHDKIAGTVVIRA